MSTIRYLVLTRAVEGKLKEFESWYDGRHLRDVCAVPGIKSAKRYRVVKPFANGMEVPHWDSVAIYEIDAQNPGSALEALNKIAYTEAMPISDALGPQGVQFLIEEVASFGPGS
jgi:hypothetical protein